MYIIYIIYIICKVCLERSRMVVLVSPSFYRQRKAFYAGYCEVEILLLLLLLFIFIIIIIIILLLLLFFFFFIIFIIIFINITIFNMLCPRAQDRLRRILRGAVILVTATAAAAATRTTATMMIGRRFAAALSPRLFGTKVRGHTTRAPPVGFEPATDGIRFYAIADSDKTSHGIYL